MKNEYTTYVPLNNGTEFNELRIETDYTLGGMNYFSGKPTPRGYYAYIKPVKRSDSGTGFSVESSMLLGNQKESGFKVLLEQTTRKNQKRLNELAEIVKDCAKLVGEIYNHGDYTAIATLLHNRVGRRKQ